MRGLVALALVLASCSTPVVAFTIPCRDGDAYTLKFHREPALPLLASVCQIEDVISVRSRST